ncbi:MAG: PilW family protein [Gammaproteobacteria bacterium]|nr:PilW family protein [Gammaproteobacteria bacterium]MBU1623528.1 PilW family protein [Gammaproteobacteria bacterium]
MNDNCKLSAFRQTGFTLIEIMVGLAIGMLATVVILQVISMFESQKRTTTGSADAQTNGSIALYNIMRELSLAGYPLMPVENSPLECTTVTIGTTGTPGISSITPVTLTNNTSDTVTIRYGTSNMGGIPTDITGNGLPRSVSNDLGCTSGDIALISNGGTCALTTVTATSSAVPATVTLQDVDIDTATYPTIAAIATTGASISCLGTWREVSYRSAGGNLQRCNRAELDLDGNQSDCSPTAVDDDPDWLPIVAGIVNIQTQYGVSNSANSNQVSLWMDPNSFNITNIADRNRVKAIRIAVIARTDQKDASNVTTALNVWSGSASSPAPTVDLSADADWQHYRYRVFETIVPLRNVIWAKDTL